MKKRFVLKNKARFAAALMIPSAICFMLFFSSPVEGHGNENYEVIRISEGDTLWGIASRYGSGDPRKYIYDLKTLNNLKDSSIAAGDTLKLPR